MYKDYNERCNRLHELGLKFNSQEYIDGDFNVHWTEIACDTDEEFNAKLEAIKREKERRTD